MLKKLCSYPGCHKVVESGVKYCDRHKNTDRDNVIGLSEANHRRIHKEYDRGYMAKKKMQRTLYDMLQRFRREFGDGGGI